MCTSSDLAGVNASVDRATNIENFVDDNLSVNHGEVMLHDLSASAGQAQSSVQFDSAEQWRSWLKIIVRATFLGGSSTPPRYAPTREMPPRNGISGDFEGGMMSLDKVSIHLRKENFALVKYKKCNLAQRRSVGTEKCGVRQKYCLCSTTKNSSRPE